MVKDFLQLALIIINILLGATIFYSATLFVLTVSNLINQYRRSGSRNYFRGVIQISDPGIIHITITFQLMVMF